MESPAPEPTATPNLPRRPRWKRLAIVAIGLLIGIPVALRVAIAVLVTPQALVDRLESQLNARVEIGDVELALFGSPARVILKDVRFGERDDSADNAVKLGKRPAMPKSLISAVSMNLEGSPWALLSRKFDVRSLVIDQAGADIRVRESGSLNIDKLFQRPDIVAGKPNPDKKTKGIIGDAGVAPGTGEVVEAPVVIDELPYAASVKSLLFTGAHIQAVLKKKGTMVDISDLRFEVSDLDVDPKDLANHNTGTLRIHGMIRISKPEKKLEFAHLNLLGEGSIRPFDPATRALNPLITARLTLQKPSEITLLPSLEKINKKLESLKKVGINIGDKLGSSVQFLDQTSLDIEFRDGVLRTLSPLHARAQKIEIELEPGAYLHTGTNDHFFRCILVGNQTLSDRMRAQVTEKANIIPAGKARDEFLKELMDSFFLNDRFRPVCVSRGDMGDPEVELENKLPDMGKFLRGVLEDIGLDPEVQKDLQESGTKLLEELLKSQQKKKEEKKEKE